MKRFLYTQSKLVALVFVATVSSIVSCTHTPFPIVEEVTPTTPGGTSGGGTTPDCVPVPICYETVQTLISKYCATTGCHDSKTHEKGLVLSTYAGELGFKGITTTINGVRVIRTDVKNAIYQIGNEDPMPPSGPTFDKVTELPLITKWIENGVPETRNCDCVCDPNQYKFGADIKPLIDKYCGGCHSSSNKVPLTSYTEIKKYVDSGQLLSDITWATNPMPQNQSKLSDCRIAKITNWIKLSGAAND